MANEVKAFNFESNEVRTVLIDNEPWFVGKDVADTLGYKNGSRDINSHVDADDKLKYQISTSGQKREQIVINESGVFALIFGSELDSAKRFKKWVTSEVLPSIRKTGSYSVKRMTPTEMLKLQNDSILEVSERVGIVEDELVEIKDNQPVNATDYGAIGAAVSHRVHQYAAINHIDKSKRGPLFKDLNSQIKQVTGAGNRSRIKSKDYDMVIEFIENWNPTSATKLLMEQDQTA
ncbi:MAG: hypothetical protein [Caudoviricetes sp.]|nr:MAG: hypothetical protein [Caudoviricetes sp.]